MRKGLGVILIIVLFNYLNYGMAIAVWPVHDGAAHWRDFYLEAERAAREATIESAKAAQREKNFISQFIQGTHQLQSIITAAQWAQSTVKGIQDQLSFFNDVRNYIESVEGAIQSVTDMYDTVANAYQDIDKTKTRWNKLMKGNYNDIKGIKEGLLEAASLADNLDDHAGQLELDAINIAQKIRAESKARESLRLKANDINPLKAADPTLALLVKLNIQQGSEQQRLLAENIYIDRIKEILEEQKKVEMQKRERETYKEMADGLKEYEPSDITHPGLLFSKRK